MTVSIVTVLFGDAYDRYLAPWIDASLAAKPDDILVVTDMPRCHEHHYARDRVTEITTGGATGWRFPISALLNRAFQWATTDWVWFVGIDDTIRPDALTVLNGNDHADTVQVGYARSDGYNHAPPAWTNADILRHTNNSLVGCSPVKRDAWLRVGGYPDVAFEDWAMWRKMARAGCVFAYTNQIAVDYYWHPETNATMRHLSDDQNTIDALSY
jgi:hypothetical protein